VAQRSTGGAGEPCSHPDVADGHCVLCGACTHDVVLNGACYFCGETDLAISVKPVERVIPAARLRRGRGGADP
jgi:hypothetical protein